MRAAHLAQDRGELVSRDDGCGHGALAGVMNLRCGVPAGYVALLAFALLPPRSTCERISHLEATSGQIFSTSFMCGINEGHVKQRRSRGAHLALEQSVAQRP